MPSVTEILQIITDKKYGEISESILDKAKEKGTAVHFAAEVYNKTGYIGINKEYKGYLDAYIKWINDFNIDRKKIKSEMKVYNRALMYAGTIDMVYNDNCIIDIKTTAELDTEIVAVQTTAYKNTLNTNYGYDIKKCYVLKLNKDGTYKYIELEDKFTVFLSCLTIYNFLNKEV